ncbi:MAG: SDR family NAD(P)-dependent oxidoreductase, partial [Opitutales bacterium]|nr:SDR family NAD(P)-dependent oxidoreductase [Opitutales bacterium]
MNNLFDIKGKVVAITGSTGVLAGELARYLAREGAKVVFMGRTQAKLDVAMQGLESCDCLGCVADVLDRPALEKACDDILKKYGKLDALINGAGGNMSGATIPPEKTFFDLDVSQWSDVLKLNLQGTLLPIMVFGEIFKKQKYGCIVNFSSMT